MKVPTLDQQGFTILEVLISSVVMTIAILGASFQYISQLQSEAGIKTQMQNRLILNQMITTLNASASLFPQITNEAGIPAIYVACYSPVGAMVPNAIEGSGSSEYTALFIELTEHGYAQKLSLGNGGLVACDLPQGGFEVHISWVMSGKYAGSVRINSIILLSNAKAFMPSSTSIASYVYP